MTSTELPLHVELIGQDPAPGVDAFVLVHGYAASSFTWRHWAPRLAARGHVVSVDLKGFGRAPKPNDGRYGPADQAELVHRLIEQRDLRDVTLVGHSLGGGVALMVVLRLLDDASSRLRRLVLVAGAAYEQRLPPFATLARFPRTSSLLFRLVGARRVVEGALRSVVHDPTSVSQDQIRGYAEPLDSPDALRVLVSAGRQLVPPELPSLTLRYPEITVPTLLLWGRRDPVVPLSVARRLAAEMPDARLHVLDRCGHLPAEEQPDESFAVLADFLSKTASPQRIST